ncbi:MAG: electron transport complex subunit RsxE [Sphaerochaetaceae bacterium]|jgi:electron transport complex protein RnfE|nr:electron transport complex subunit RsxE [Sphaerochaetaceae bacterium]
MNIKEFTKGLFKENPTFIIMLGMCPTLGVTTQVVNALGMGAAVIFVLTFSNILISALKKIIPDCVRIPCYIVVIACFVSIVEMVMHAYLPSVFNALGVYLPLVVVNCIILGRAEAFANKNSVGDSALDGLGMGLGFTMSLTLIALIREVIGAGTITLIPIGSFSGTITIPGLSANPVRVMSLAAGALLLMGLLKAFFQYLQNRKEAR